MTMDQDAAAPKPQILCVDDEPSILASLKRLLRPHGFDVTLANSGAEGLALMAQQPFDLVLSDMRMPVMDGVVFLRQARERWPDTLRLLLTGYADITSTIAAINEGQIYRYIAKPWNDEELVTTIRQALRHRALEMENRRLQDLTARQNAELLELNTHLEHRVVERTEELSRMGQRVRKNYLSFIKTFSTIGEWRNSQIAGHSRRVAELARRTAKAMGLGEQELQDIFIAALIHDIGLVSLPDSALEKPVSLLKGEEMARYNRHPVLGEQVLLGLEDQQNVAAYIRGHHERHDGHGFPDGIPAEMTPLGARILAVADTYDDLCNGYLTSASLGHLEAGEVIRRGRGTQFDPEVVDVFMQVLYNAAPGAEDDCVYLEIHQLKPGMVLGRDLLTAEKVVLLTRGHVLTEELIDRLRTREIKDKVVYRLPIRRR